MSPIRHKPPGYSRYYYSKLDGLQPRNTGDREQTGIKDNRDQKAPEKSVEDTACLQAHISGLEPGVDWAEEKEAEIARKERKNKRREKQKAAKANKNETQTNGFLLA
ncbi:hypothetical protein H112_00067 [Trichophyton rubrum D6]|uniref:Uncharacterized protein n=2 Tax=Trichophyton TaxID=5550 RepID=A0A022WH71_TRIRU|nr:hypothetical protein H100_00065 [Trichophyton rubrum MR850]EZF47054.1 hypothetical protein H102_00064 [Trichophyton rubrum CBS 100081]EZF57712.1 hypothetical protein H103_00066 [Trichophyton rubrum CBS 288.86]EZF68312.1 hypothetical protein H104_00064 [Trichophyton rubrum CBS 289.86]EZF78991.1 hypothetical protein H105_00056 [Trichophyton soudanense CBS 452.61]EZF89564.1 hypothetical protein H110_00065 [Trichophyton rubrum MR1448]EZG00379.1 hypothetical protein H113_00067 [Trichophyton rub